MMPSGLMVVTVVEMWWWGWMREMETGQQVPHPGQSPFVLSCCRSITNRAVVALEEKLGCQAGTDSQAL